MELLAALDLTGEVGRTETPSLREYAKHVYLGLRNLVHRNPVRHGQTEVVCYGRGRRKNLDGEWWDLYFDPVYENFDHDYLHLESAWAGTHFTPARTTNLSYVDFIHYLGLFAQTSGFLSRSLDAADRRVLERIEERIREAFGVETDLVTKVERFLSGRAVEKPLYDALLDRLDPELAMVTVYGSKTTFVESCQDAGIPVAELQHGQISRFSYNYSFPSDREVSVFPDYFLSFGEAWGEMVDLPLEPSRVHAVGYPHLERQLARNGDAGERRTIVFISAPETGEALSRVAADASRRADVPFDVQYKLHPDEAVRWNEDYPWLQNAPVDVVSADGQSVYELFASASAQVGVCSTALYEGLAFGLDTYLVDLPTVEWNDRLVEAGTVTLVTDAADLAAATPQGPPGTFDRERYFEPEPIPNIRAVIADLIEDATLRRAGTDTQ